MVEFFAFFPASLCGVLVFVVRSRPSPVRRLPSPSLSYTHTQLSQTHTQLPHIQLSHTQLTHNNLLAHNSLTHTQLSHTHNSLARNSHTQLSHTQLSQTHTHNFLTYNSLTHNLLTTTYSHTTLLHTHTTLSHTTLLHATLTHNSLTHTTYSHTTLSHTTGVAGVALGDIDLRVMWQARRLWHWASSGGPLGFRWRSCRRGCLCIAGVALRDIDLLSVSHWRCCRRACLCGRRAIWKHRRAFCGRRGNSEPEAVTRRVEKFAVANRYVVSLRFHPGTDRLTWSSIASHMPKLIWVKHDVLQNSTSCFSYVHLPQNCFNHVDTEQVSTTHCIVRCPAVLRAGKCLDWKRKQEVKHHFRLWAEGQAISRSQATMTEQRQRMSLSHTTLSHTTDPHSSRAHSSLMRASFTQSVLHHPYATHTLLRVESTLMLNFLMSR